MQLRLRARSYKDAMVEARRQLNKDIGCWKWTIEGVPIKLGDMYFMVEYTTHEAIKDRADNTKSYH